MRSRNSIRWLLFVLATSASAAAVALELGVGGRAGVGVGAGVDSGAGVGVDLGVDARVGAGGNVEGAPVQGMTGADADARGGVDANTSDHPRGSAGADANVDQTTRSRGRIRDVFRGRGGSSVSGSAQGGVSGSVGAFGPASGD